MAEDDQPIYPVTGWEAFSLTMGEAVLALHFVPGIPAPGTTTEDIRAAERIQRFGLTEEQCDLLAELLSRLAAQSRERRGNAH